MEIVAGTYEELLLGYKINKSEDGFEFETSFTDHSHTGMVKALAVSSRGMVASGSSDETIKLLNLRTRRESGTLMHHTGSITCLTFFGKKHMFSSSEDGTIGVWRVGKWECLRTLKGHKGAVNSISVHPTGKMALSVGKDKTLCTWNLITGKVAYKTSIKSDADAVHWTPKGNKYIIVINNTANIYDVETAASENTIKLPGRINAVQFLSEDSVCLSGEGGKVQVFDLKSAKELVQFSTETNRVKCMACSKLREDGSQELVTASSDGFLKIWTINQTNWSVQCDGSFNTKFRLTHVILNEVPGSGNVDGEQSIEATEDTGLEENEQEEEQQATEVTTAPDSKKSLRKKKRKANKQSSDLQLGKRKCIEVEVTDATISKRKAKKLEKDLQKVKPQTEKAQKKKQLF